MRKGSVLVGILMLLSGLMTVGIALGSSVLSSSIKIQRQYKRLEALSYAEAGLNKGLWKLNNGDLTYASAASGILESDLPGGEYRVKITNCPAPATDCKYLVSEGFTPSEANPVARRTVRVKIKGVINSTNISFNYGVQVDELGAYLEENSTVKGSIFTAGPIMMENKATITGNAVSHGHNFLQSFIGTDGVVKMDANAYIISGTKVEGTKTTGTYPADKAMPIDPAQMNSTIDTWETAAQNGGLHTGNLTTSGTNNVLGPIKIDGDWTVGNNAQVKIKGTVWVTGNIYIQNNAKLYLDPTYGNNSGLIIADYKIDRTNFNKGRISISQGATISGIDKNNPKTPSYIMLFSTQSPKAPFETFWKLWPAITIEQGSVGGVYYAPFGSLDLKQNAQARALASSGLIIRQNAIVDYDGGMANSSFATGPAGKWTITEWLILN